MPHRVNLLNYLQSTVLTLTLMLGFDKLTFLKTDLYLDFAFHDETAGLPEEVKSRGQQREG